jgi:hypothetical protein
MKRGGHSSPAAALRYQHATAERDRDLASALAAMAPHLSVVSTEASENPAEEMRRKSLDQADDEATITPLTSHNDEQSQRGSNPCLHLERAERIVPACPSRCRVMSFLQATLYGLGGRWNALTRAATPWNGFVGWNVGSF